MALEIELKAHVDNFDRIKSFLDNNCEFKGRTVKKDVYFRAEKDSESSLQFRLRVTEARQVVTAKRKKIVDQTEVNQEIEFGIDNPIEFEKFARYIGFFEHIAKKKTAYVYKNGPILCELCHLEELGDFLELEILLEEESEELILKARKSLHSFLEKTGIPEEMIEVKYYTQMLKEKRQ